MSCIAFLPPLVHLSLPPLFISPLYLPSPPPPLSSLHPLHLLHPHLLHLHSPHFTPPDDNHWSSKASQATNSSGPLSSELLGDVAGADVIIIDDIVGTYMCLYVGGGGRGYIGLYLI